VNPDDVAVSLVVRELTFRNEVFVTTGGLAMREFLLFWAGPGSEDWDTFRALRAATRGAIICPVVGTETTRRLFRASNAPPPWKTSASLRSSSSNVSSEAVPPRRGLREAGRGRVVKRPVPLVGPTFLGLL